VAWSIEQMHLRRRRLWEVVRAQRFVLLPFALIEIGDAHSDVEVARQADDLEVLGFAVRGLDLNRTRTGRGDGCEIEPAANTTEAAQPCYLLTSRLNESGLLSSGRKGAYSFECAWKNADVRYRA
jgi:hypothetical protein